MVGMFASRCNAFDWAIKKFNVMVDWPVAVPELPELGMVTSSDPVFGGYNVSPKRISGLLSRQWQI
jgi:hypothetical protein